MSRPATTGSKATTPVSFRLSTEQRKRLETAAAKRLMSAGQLACAVLLAWLESRRPPEESGEATKP